MESARSCTLGPIDGPAYLSLVFAVNTLHYQGRLGRPQSNLFSLILHDLSVREICLNNLHDLNHLRYIAQDRAQWRRLQQSCSWERLGYSVVV